MVFMCLTYVVLPTSATARHYLTTAPIIGFIFLSVWNNWDHRGWYDATDGATQTAYVVPLARPPNQCHDTITPNDFRSDSMCGATAILQISGIWVVVISCP